MIELPIILDGLIEEELQNQIEDAMFECSWTYHSDNCLGSPCLGKNYREILNPLQYNIAPFFVSDLKIPRNKKSYDKVIKMVKRGCDEVNFNIEKIERCYGAIHALIRNKSKHDGIHLNRGEPHLVMLYYVNDSDGDTILYDKTVEDIPYDVSFYSLYPEEYCKLKVKHRISPKKGRILFFDGRVYHASSTPTKSIRCIITLDLFGKFKDKSYEFPVPERYKKNISSNLLKYK
jgi:hypothetical protein